MNYNKIYENLVLRGKNRVLVGYKEIHHIIPKCMGGDDSPTNLVSLTPEEHYIAHQLLAKMNPDNRLLVYAVIMMTRNRPTNKLYGWLRRRFAKAKSTEQSGIGNSQYNTCWINHELFGPKRIDSSLFDEYVYQGWFLGKTLKYVKAPHVRVVSDKRLSDIRLYRTYYTLYSQVGYDEFVKQTGYKYSKANLVQRFAKLLPEFKPQNGKKRN